MRDGIVVELDELEVKIAELIGEHRHLEGRANGGTEHFVIADGDDARRERNAAGAELAVCKVLGGWWETIAGHRAPGDVRVDGTLVEVKHTPHATGFLALKDRDRSALVVMVVGELPTFRVVGWGHTDELRAAHPIAETNPRNGRPLPFPCHVVEQHELKPLLDRRTTS